MYRMAQYARCTVLSFTTCDRKGHEEGVPRPPASRTGPDTVCGLALGLIRCSVRVRSSMMSMMSKDGAGRPLRPGTVRNHPTPL